jgi:outer membrane protein TolC
MNHQHSLALALALGLALTGPAAAAEALSLRDAVRRAVEGNTELQKARVSVEIAEARVLEAAGRFDFVSRGGLGYARKVTPSLSGQDAVGGATRTLGLNLGLARPLETGGSVGLGLDTSRVETTSRLQSGQVLDTSSAATTFYNSKLTLDFTHPLWRGLGSEIATANLRKQRIRQSMALLNRQMQAGNAIRDVVVAYWELAYATQAVAIAQAALQLAQEQLRITQAMIEVGRLAAVDSAAVERAIGQRQQELALAEQTLYFRSLELQHLFGRPSQVGAPPLAAADMPQAQGARIDVAAEIQRALDNNPQLRSLRMGVELSEVDVQIARDTLDPKLDFVGQLGASGRRAGFADSFSQLGDSDNLSWSAGLSFELPLENRSARGQLRAARLAGTAAGLDADSFALALRELVLRLASSARTAGLRVELARKEVGFARVNLEAEKARFTVGRSTNNDVLLRQQELKDSETRVVRAEVDLLSAEAALAAASAEILERYDVSLAGT